jgi:23S rRNA pseudouridine1911/1915/1917 synthase
LLEYLRHRLNLPWSAGRALIKEGKILVNGQVCKNPELRLQQGQRIQASAEPRLGAAKPRQPAPPVNLHEPGIVYEDEHIVVVDKPPGLTTMRHPEEAAEFGERGRKYLPTTLADLLPRMLAAKVPGRRASVHAVHRLDKDTSGLVLFARTREAERELGKLFRAHRLERRYLAIVRGQAHDARLESWLVPDRGDGRRGSTSKPGQGQRAITHVKVVENLGDFTLVECRLETGRTHQVRIHLGEAGTPLCGERIYDRPLHGAPLPDGSGLQRIALHAHVLGLEHPITGQPLRWVAPLPADLRALLEQLRARKMADNPANAGKPDDKPATPDAATQSATPPLAPGLPGG